MVTTNLKKVHVSCLGFFFLLTKRDLRLDKDKLLLRPSILNNNFLGGAHVINANSNYFEMP